MVGINDSLLNIEYNLRVEKDYYNVQIKENNNPQTYKDSVRLVELKNEHLKICIQYDDNVKNIERKYPEYYNIKYNKKLCSVKEVQSVLPENSALIVYLIGDSLINIIIISKYDYNNKSVKITSSFDDDIITYIRCVKKLSLSEFSKRSNELYNILIKPIKKYFESIDKLIIIPDDILSFLPFETLIPYVPLNDKKDFSKYHYLINDYTISYHFSANL